MSNPIEDRDALTMIASVADCFYASPPDTDPPPGPSQSEAERGARWAEWLRDELTRRLTGLGDGSLHRTRVQNMNHFPPRLPTATVAAAIEMLWKMKR